MWYVSCDHSIFIQVIPLVGPVQKLKKAFSHPANIFTLFAIGGIRKHPSRTWLAILPFHRMNSCNSRDCTFHWVDNPSDRAYMCCWLPLQSNSDTQDSLCMLLLCPCLKAYSVILLVCLNGSLSKHSHVTSRISGHTCNSEIETTTICKY